MTTFISMIRGINVGGHHVIRMEELRKIYEDAGLKNARTVLQSGNVIFQTSRWDAPALQRRIEKALLNAEGVEARVIIRTSGELRTAIEQNPFPVDAGREPSRLLVMFFAEEPAADSKQRLLGVVTRPEEAHFRGRELYLYYGGEGMGRSRLTGALIEKTLRCPGTARNWNTTLKLMEISESM